MAGLTITTYSMVSHSGTRSEQSAKVRQLTTPMPECSCAFG